MAIIFDVFIQPLVNIIEVIYTIIYRVLCNEGLSIVCLSIVISSLIMPLYKKSDAIQEEERERQKEMSAWVSHIKKHFRGDERVMILSTYYREKNYKQIYSLRSSFSLLLQIPFFIAAYRYLSALPILRGASFGFISDLSKPDGALQIGTLCINVLPILMTLINCISGMIYSRDMELKDKLQIYLLSGLFLILLYNRPAGLVLYWTMNNVFSLIKNIFTKILKDTVYIKALVVLIVYCMSGILFYIGRIHTIKRKVFLIIVLIASAAYLIKALKDRKAPSAYVPEKKYSVGTSGYDALFIASGVFMTIITGALIPSNLIADSPMEFINPSRYIAPTHYILVTSLVSAGLFVIWAFVFYYLAEDRWKKLISIIYCIISASFAVNYFFFGRHLGNISSSFVYDNAPIYSINEVVLNICVLTGIAAIITFAASKFNNLLLRFSIILSVVVFLMSTTNIISINRTIKQSDIVLTPASKDPINVEPVINLSQNGKNVVVLMMDRALGDLVPYILKERPDLKDTFSGFTYYPNTLSMGATTNYGTPELFGGYEYTPVEINKRPDMLLVEKQNEALKVMPVLFLNNGYNVTVCDPSYANYSWIPDLSIYDEYENINAYNLEGKYTDTLDSEYQNIIKEYQERGFFFFSIFKAAPVLFQGYIYDGGMYFASSVNHAINQTFLDAFSVLTNLKNLTSICQDNSNNFLMMANHTTHSPEELQMPDYMPSTYIDNSNYFDPEFYVVDGKKLTFTPTRISHYQHYEINMASFLQIGNWLEYLKENGVYDNTRIIIVSDHGFPLGMDPDLLWPGFLDAQNMNPLLMVKDFNSDSFSVSEEFMTNADVPTIAVKDTIKDAINPFTGKSINNDRKYQGPMICTNSQNWKTEENNGYLFDSSDGHWYTVHDNIFVRDNWEMIEEPTYSD